MATEKPKLRSAFVPHRRIQEHGEIINPHTGDITVPPSMTKQEFKRECDINSIVKQFSVTGMWQHVSAKAMSGAYQDLPDSYDFQESLHIIDQAEKAFLSLPAKTRERFNNEPAEFLAFMGDPKNGDEMIKLGLRIQPPAPPPAVPDTPVTGGETGGTPPPSSAQKAP